MSGDLKDHLDHERQARQAAEELLARLGVILNAAQTGVWQHEVESGRVWLSDSLLSIQGYSRDSALKLASYPAAMLSLSTASLSAIHPDDRASAEALRQALLNEESGIVEGEYRLRHRNREWIWVQERCLLEKDPSGDPVCWMGVRSNVTETREAQENARVAELNLIRTESALREAELRTLRYQINPHFLFNTLSSISTLIIDGRASDAERMVILLSDFFRSTLLNMTQKRWQLVEEIELQRKYLEIERIRFPNRISLETDVPQALEGAVVPGLLLQPLIENSVKYGARASGEPLVIRIEARAAGSKLNLLVRDNGRGANTQGGTGLGLALTRRRLRSEFGDECSLSTERSSEGFQVEIVMPLACEAPETNSDSESDRRTES